MAGSQVSTSVTIIQSLLGWQAISLTNMSTSAATAIAAGSKVEIASAFFTFGSNETPNASSWTAITTGLTAYITLTPSGTAGSQVVAAAWTDTAPVWSDSKQGWYTTAASSIRVIGGCYKIGATGYAHKFILGGVNTKHEIEFTIGDWNMDTSVSVSVAHGLGAAFIYIRGISGMVRSDAGNFIFTLPSFAGGSGYENDLCVDTVDATSIYLDRRAGGRFDTSTFSSIGYNRGWLYLDMARP